MRNDVPLPGSLATETCASVMIADHGLHNSQAKAGAVRLGCVIRREQALALLGGETLPGVGDFDPDTVFMRHRP